MEIDQIVDALEMNSGLFRHILAPNSPMDVDWKPTENNWSLQEIVCHLHDREILDFRPRIEHILEYPEMPMPDIDPLSWVESHGYADQDYLIALQHFIGERQKSIDWLNILDEVHWKNIHNHPKLGSLTAYQILVNWLAHDYLHIRQINRLRYQFLERQSGVSLQYAGDY